MNQQMTVNSMEKVRKGLSGSTLKIIAIVTMLIDHIGASIIELGILSKYNNLTAQEYTNLITNDAFIRNMYWVDMVMRMIGRLSFPLFCFLLIEGFLHTRNVKKYIFRMLAFCFISEIPFDFAFTGQLFSMGHQNVFFTLLIALLVLAGYEKFKGDDLKNKALRVVMVLSGMIVAEILKTDYASFGVAFVFILYFFRNNHLYRNIVGCFSISWELTAPLSFIFIHFYDGRRGFSLKYIFYLFYPVHLLMLGIITKFII